MPIQNSYRKSSFDRYLFEICLAVELLMSFSFLGYLHFSSMSVTIAYIPILIAGCCFGVLPATVTGFAFGLAGLYKASASYILQTDIVFSPFYSGKPVESLLLSIGMRTLYGFVIGIAYAWAKRRKHHPFLWMCAVSAVAPFLHTLFVFSGYGFLFPELGYNWKNSFVSPFGHFLLAALCVIVTGVVWKLYSGKAAARLRGVLRSAESTPYVVRHMTHQVIFSGLTAFALTFVAAVYFSERTAFMLQQRDVEVSSAISLDLMLLQLQFVFAILALLYIVLVILLILSKRTAYRSFISEMDDLTGVMGRRMFLEYFDKQQEKYTADSDSHKSGWLLLVDVDYFKKINDTFGHLTGDRVLQEFAAALKDAFAASGIVARIGGDEFVVLVEKPLSTKDVTQCAESFMRKISGILAESSYTVTASIGGCRVNEFSQKQKLFEAADARLYEAKQSGRAQVKLSDISDNR